MLFILEFKLLFKKGFHKLRLVKKKEADDTIILVSINIKIRYNFKHLIINFQQNDEIYLKLYYNYLIFGVFNKKLFQ